MIDMEQDSLGIEEHEGWFGEFTTRQAQGAIPNGTKVVKALDEPGDGHRIGDTGVVLGSIAMPDEAEFMTKLGQVRHFYFIEFSDRPRVAVGIVDVKVRAA